MEIARRAGRTALSECAGALKNSRPVLQPIILSEKSVDCFHYWPLYSIMVKKRKYEIHCDTAIQGENRYEAIEQLRDRSIRISTRSISFNKNDNGEEENRNSDYFKSLKMFWNMVVRYKNKIQFIFVDIPDDIIFDRQRKNSICLTTLSDGVISGKNAKIYIRNKISEFGFENFENTFDYDKILDNGQYSIFEIDELIKLWQEDVLKKKIFGLYN